MIAMHPGEYVSALIDGGSFASQTELASSMGVHQPVVSRLVNCRLDVTCGMALRLEMATGRSAESWIAMQLDYDRATDKHGLGELAPHPEPGYGGRYQPQGKGGDPSLQCPPS